MKKKNKGFTLIELLAVIVILGLLMAIAIPSVTKYINQSRKKTLVGTISNYMGAIVNDVNDNMSYSFTDTNTVYAVPIDCISVEKGGKNPLGEWLQSSDYWAYVLVQYDKTNYNYRYAFTFKDSKNNGLHPTGQAKLEKSGSQIESNTTVVKPVTGDLKGNWENSGFTINDNTKIQVLESRLDGKKGDGKYTCTLQQKGKNYDELVKTLASNVIKEEYEKQKNDSKRTIHYHDRSGANDGSYRYYGANPNNYVCFGSDEETCPEDNLYRIIGVFGDNVKLIKVTALNNRTYFWNSTNGSELTSNSVIIDGATYYNYWEKDGVKATLNEQLNGSLYYDTLDLRWQNMITSYEWNVGGYTTTVATAKTFYSAEVKEKWNGKIGLISASEYGFAQSDWSRFLGEHGSDVARDGDINDSELENWLRWITLSNPEHTITRVSSRPYWIFEIINNSYVRNVSSFSFSAAVRPAFYLDSNVKIVGGAGTDSNPYVLSV